MISASASLPAVPTQGTVLVDLGPDDPEYISVEEQVNILFNFYTPENRRLVGDA